MPVKFKNLSSALFLSVFLTNPSHGMEENPEGDSKKSRSLGQSQALTKSGPRTQESDFSDKEDSSSFSGDTSSSEDADLYPQSESDCQGEPIEKLTFAKLFNLGTERTDDVWIGDPMELSSLRKDPEGKIYYFQYSQELRRITTFAFPRAVKISLNSKNNISILEHPISLPYLDFAEKNFWQFLNSGKIYLGVDSIEGKPAVRLLPEGMHWDSKSSKASPAVSRKGKGFSGFTLSRASSRPGSNLLKLGSSTPNPPT